MARTAAIASLALLAAVAFALSSASAARSEWHKQLAAPAAAPFSFQLAVSHDEHVAAMLESTCQQVSDPTSPSYSQYLTMKEVTKLVAAPAKVGALSAFFYSAGASSVSAVANEDAMRITMPVAAAEAAMGLELHLYTHATQADARIIRSEKPFVLPEHLADMIDVAMGLNDFPSLNNRAGRQVRDAVKTSMSKRASREAGAAGQPPIEPTVGLLYVSETTTTIGVSVECNGAHTFMSNTSQPCTNTDYPVTFETQLWLDGKLVANDLPVPASDVSMEVEPSLFGTAYVYNVKVPYTIKPFQAVNVSIRAVNSVGKSAYTQMAYQNLKPSLKRVLATPYITPEFLHSYYGLPAMEAAPTGTNQAVAEFEGQFYKPEDLAAFYAMYKLPESPITLHGLNVPQLPGGESTLDIEWITAAAPGVPTDFWYASPDHKEPASASFIIGWAIEMNNATNPPLVTSISYGLGEAQYPTDGFGSNYISRTNLEFLKLCARGVGIVVAAGDAGASNDGHGSNSCAVQPDFPSSSPWVTTVSASFVDNTAPVRPGTSQLGELPITIGNGMFWDTGGGFSSEPTCKRPWYQEDVVTEYLSTAAGTFPPSSMFNASGRAYPDVSALGHNLMCIWDGSLVPVDGTSASSPIFAGILTRLNAARMAAGKKQLGFANPVLYHLNKMSSSAFYDMTQGNNNCAAFTCCPYGYSAAKGYDAVSGLGSIGDYNAIKQMVLDLP